MTYVIGQQFASNLGSPDLKIGTTLAILSQDGHIPVLKDSLKS